MLTHIHSAINDDTKSSASTEKEHELKKELELILERAFSIYEDNADNPMVIDTNPVMAWRYLTTQLGKIAWPDNLSTSDIVPDYTPNDDPVEFYFVYNNVREYMLSL
ncbi:hypothetical protein [uncultured Photobacterium sp.]|uniref:hypothetical protein n=1 Tax=uncultured Photobacterium sp. TaxID=173973 RepID=UPI00263196A1|nr:hypothetical protein [uncultured Photobacterium sp.]